MDSYCTRYCYQWPYYAATFFDVDLQRQKKQLIGGTKADHMKLTINTEWVCIVEGATNTLRAMISMDQVTYEANSRTITLECSNASQVAGLHPYVRPGVAADSIVMSSFQAYVPFPRSHPICSSFAHPRVCFSSYVFGRRLIFVLVNICRHA